MHHFLKFLNETNFLNLDNIMNDKTPEEFFRILKDGLINSNQAYISTMYFGEDQQTNELFQLIKIRNINNKKTFVFMDKERGMSKKIKETILEHELMENFYFVEMNSWYLPGRIPELMSVFHSKVMLFDDKIILTGANIDKNYFKSRIDRYLVVESKSVAKRLIEMFFRELLGYSTKQGELNVIRMWELQKNRQMNEIKFNKYSRLTNDIVTSEILKSRILMYDEKYEFKVLESIIKVGFDEIYLSTAYLNFPNKYIELLKDTKIKIFVSDPKTNTFTNYGMFCNTVTEIYKYSSLRTAINLPNAQIYEFRKDGYTMHAKGIWAFSETMSVSMVGSSNFNRRSSERDSEINFLLVVNKKEHVKILRDEVQFLLRYSVQRGIDELRSRNYNILAIIIYFLLNRFL